MNLISCDLCMDLIPLVKDGVASLDSQTAVENHVSNCPVCRALYDGAVPPVPDSTDVFRKLRRRIQLFAAFLMMLGIFFGLSLTGGQGLFYNILIMPVIGALGYLLFRWKSLYQVPLLLLITHFAINLLGIARGMEHLDFYSLVMWTFFYSVFAALGSLAAGLLHFAFRKEH